MLKNTVRNILYLFILVSAAAQNTGNSPYSIYGIGDIYRNGFSNNRGMGGLAMGMRKPNSINYLNPASYTSQDSMSFIFDLGGSYTHRNLQSSSASLDNSVVNVDYLAAAFPVTKWWACSFGLAPYSRVGYNINQIDSLPPITSDSITTRYEYEGSGGIYQAYLGNAFRFLNHFSVGFNLCYLFGSINENKAISYPGGSTSDYINKTFIQKSNRIGNMYYDFGFQYFTTINEKHFLTAGFSFNTTSTIHYKQDYIYFNVAQSKLTNQEVKYPAFNDTIAQSTGSRHSMKIPKTIGIGLTYNYDNRILAGVDLYQQKYLSNTSYPVRIGLEITPNPKSLRSYFSRIHYRVGAQYTNSYLLINNNNINDMRLTAGLGFPFSKTKNEFNIAVEYGRRGTVSDNLILEKYMIVTCSMRFYEFWFFRRKYD